MKPHLGFLLGSETLDTRRRSIDIKKIGFNDHKNGGKKAKQLKLNLS